MMSAHVGQRPTRAADDRSLLPKEHGAYAQVGLPLLAALASGVPTLGAALLATSVASAFVAHEPARVLLGHRGSRARREDANRAKNRLIALVGCAVSAGSVGLFVAPNAWRALPLVMPSVIAATVVAAKNIDRSLYGELIAAVALPGLSVPVALACGVPIAEALGAWSAWVFAFAMSTFAVRALTAKSPAERATTPWLVFGFAAIAIIGALAGWTIAMCLAPIIIVAVTIVVVRPGLRHMRRIGWSFAAAVTMTAVAIVVHARA
jgi:YwiC-like protein